MNQFEIILEMEEDVKFETSPTQDYTLRVKGPIKVKYQRYDETGKLESIIDAVFNELCINGNWNQ